MNHQQQPANDDARARWVALPEEARRRGLTTEALRRWCDLHEDAPLRRVVIARQVHHRSREVEPTKTRELRVVPEHPALRAALELWRRSGWRAAHGRDRARAWGALRLDEACAAWEAAW